MMYVPALKVCGMKDGQNIAALAALAPQYMGFIFYKNSPRHALELDPALVRSIAPAIEKVGVFVNAEYKEIRDCCQLFGIKTLQLHGEETPEQCLELKNSGFTIIKAFSIDPDFDFSELKNYAGVCDYYLFDTKGGHRGGNGIAFDWSLLRQYDNSVPFFLSGGIDRGNLQKLKEMNGMNLHAVDVNSKFETAPGMKDIQQVALFQEQLTALYSNLKI